MAEIKKTATTGNEVKRNQILLPLPLPTVLFYINNLVMVKTLVTGGHKDLSSTTCSIKATDHQFAGKPCSNPGCNHSHTGYVT